MSHRDPHRVSDRTKARRDRRALTYLQSRRAKELRDQGLSFDDIDTALGVEAGTTLAASGSWRDADGASGNAVMNVAPEDRDRFRQNHCFPGDGIRSAFNRHLDEAAYHRTWADMTGCPPYSGLSPEPPMFSHCGI